MVLKSIFSSHAYGNTIAIHFEVVIIELNNNVSVLAQKANNHEFRDVLAIIDLML